MRCPLLTQPEGIHSEAARGEMCVWVLTGEGSLDGGQESTKVGGGVTEYPRGRQQG